MSTSGEGGREKKDIDHSKVVPPQGNRGCTGTDGISAEIFVASLPGHHLIYILLTRAGNIQPNELEVI
jgi:hypothetical protein